MRDLRLARQLAVTGAWAIPLAACWYWLIPQMDPLLGWMAAKAIGTTSAFQISYAANPAGIEISAWDYRSLTTYSAISNSRVFTWGLPLGLAIVLSRPRPARHVVYVVAAAAFVGAWGVTFDVLLQFAKDAPRVVGIASASSGNLVALAYQAGCLLLPGVATLLVAIGPAWREFVPLFDPAQGTT
jgi:hypothetical protein